MDQLKSASILMVDDNPELLEMLRNILTNNGYQNLYMASSCIEARSLFYTCHPDFIILDVMLPDGDGFSLLKEFRLLSQAPVLFLSAKDEDEDRLTGLGLGADDYLTKPFLPQELLLRMQAILKRTFFSAGQQTAENDTVRIGQNMVHFPSAVIKRSDEEYPMTAKELAILKKLYENRGNIVTFDALCEAVWGDSYYGYENTLMVHIRHLREKIEEDPSKPEWILNVRGLGYKLAREAKGGEG